MDTKRSSKILKIGKADRNGIIYLKNSAVTIEGIKIWGSPVTPYFLGMAFNKRRGEAIRKIWQQIPSDTDILITHGPPFGVRDKKVGCEELLTQVGKLQPKIHVFGHVHGEYGVSTAHHNHDKNVKTTTLYNVALTDSIDYLQTGTHKIVLTPVVIYL